MYKHGPRERRSRSASFSMLKCGVLGTARTFDRIRLREIRTLSMSPFVNTRYIGGFLGLAGSSMSRPCLEHRLERGLSRGASRCLAAVSFPGPEGPDHCPWQADSLLEGDGFEPSVPGYGELCCRALRPFGVGAVSRAPPQRA